MTQLEALEKAIAVGWEGEKPRSMLDHALFLSPSFWKSLGISMGWREKTYNEYPYKRFKIESNGGVTIPDETEWKRDTPEWIVNWHRFIDHLAQGESIESFFEKL